MNRTISIAPVRKEIRVKASQSHAVEVFTAGLGRWWPRTHGIGNPPMQMAVLEPRLGGRWDELSQDGSQVDIGQILVWEPPHRFVVSWNIGSDWKPDAKVGSEVEVGSSPKGRKRRWSNWNIASSSGWERTPVNPCARTSTAAGPRSWSTSRPGWRPMPAPARPPAQAAECRQSIHGSNR